ncbi:MAG: SCO family protein [Deltaproteobacteria bacterium]|nr:SCO family protein [Nannocystaceae bacterium]
MSRPVTPLARSLHVAVFGAFAAAWSCVATVHADEPVASSPLAKPMSPEMRAIEVDEHRSERIDGALTFVDPAGNAVKAADWFDGKRPVLLTLNYYRCRVVCSVQLNGLADALGELDWTPGDENFRVVTVSLDADELAADASHKREQILDQLGKGADVDWQFLRADEVTIQALAAQLGISFAYDAEQDQFAHPAVAMFLTPDGTIAQYVYGITYESRDLKLALLESGQGKIGSPMEQLYLSCFTYDHTIGRYGPWAFGIMRLGGTLTFLILASTLAIFWRRERRHRLPVPLSNDPRVEAVS